MAITGTNLLQFASGTDASSYTPGTSISPGANRLILASVENSVPSGTATTPTFSGCGLTWVQEETRLYASNIRRLTIFRAMGTPSTGQVTADFGGTSQTGASIIVDEFDGVDTTGTDGSGAVRQSEPNSGVATSGSVTLAAFGSTGNGTFGAFVHQANEGATPGSGFTELGDIGHPSPVIALMTEWRSDNDTSVDASWATNANWAGIALEIVASAGGGVVGVSLATLWNTRAPVAKSLEGRWDVRTMVSSVLDARWPVRSVVPTSLDSRWHVRSPVGASLDSRWNIRTAVGRSLEAPWRVLTSVPSSLEARWAVRAPVGSALDARWAVLVSGMSAVGVSLDSRWNVRAAVGTGLEARWRVLIPAASSLDSRWRVLVPVGDDLAASWHVRAAAGRSLDARWNAGALAASSLDARWRVLTMVAFSLDARWAVRIRVGVSLAAVWNLDGATVVFDLYPVHVTYRERAAVSYREQASVTWRER